jgi:serine/threonine protein kinase
MAAACKIIIFPGGGGQCIFLDKIIELKGADDTFFQIPGEGGPYYIDRESYGIFASTTYKSYLVVPIPGKQVNERQVFSLSPLTESEFIRYQKDGRLDAREFKEPIVLASGTYGKASLRPTEGTVVKETINKKGGEGLPQDLVKEIAYYSLLRRIACLPELFDFSVKFPNFSLRMAAGAETLANAIRGRRLTADQKRVIMFRMASCLRAIASQGVINCDLKPQNSVLTRDGTVLLIDWGLAEIDYTTDQTILKNTQIQTLWYKAPEILAAEKDERDAGYSNKVDIFSLGLIFIEIMTGDPAVPGEDKNQQARSLLRILLDVSKETVDTIQKIYQSLRSQIRGPDTSRKIAEVLGGDRYKIADETLRDLIGHMLVFNPEHRFDYERIVSHPYFRGLNSGIPNQPKYINNMPLVPNLEVIYPGKNIKMRPILFGWMGEVVVKLKLSNNTLCLAFQLVDLYIQKIRIIVTKEFQSIGVASILIASKIHQNWPMLLSDCVYFCDNVYTSVQIEEMEQKILFALNGNICIPTLCTYFQQYKPSEILADPKASSLKFLEFYLRPDIYAKPFAEIVGVILPEMVYATSRSGAGTMPPLHPVDLVKPGPERGKYGQSPRSGKRPTPK